MRVSAFILAALMFSLPASADLCRSVTDLKVKSETNKEIRLYKELFPEADHFGSHRYNAFILECNRNRDATGKTMTKLLTDSEWSYMKDTLRKDNLPAHFFKFNYHFAGLAPFKMRYAVWKKNGEWQVLIPYRYSITETIKNRIDLNKSHAGKLYEKSQLKPKDSASQSKYELKADPKPVWETLCSGKPTYVKGKKGKYKGKSGEENAHKRDRKNKFIDRGRIEFKYSKDSGLAKGCRVKRNVHLYGKDPMTQQFVKVRPDKWILNNFIAQGESYWSVPNNFRLHISLRGVNENRLEPSARKVLNALVTQKGERLPITFASEFMPHHGNQMYKSNILQPHNFSTMTTDGTYKHEVGHALGLDDEYDFAGKVSKNACEDSRYQKIATRENGGKSGAKTYSVLNYTMCSGYGRQWNTIYHYIAISRYLLGEICEQDADCGQGRYCNRRLGVNRCLAESSKKLGKSCRKNRECQSNKCQKKGSKKVCTCKVDTDCASGQQCNKPVGKASFCGRDGVKLGATCSKHNQCRSNRCEGKKCVCNADSDCGAGKKCHRAVGKKNYCAGKAKGTQSIGKRCKKNTDCLSNKCEGKQCVCKADSDCKSGKKCFRTIGKKNYCSSTSKSLGRACKNKDECKSKKCNQSKCVCNKNSDCPKHKTCKKKALGANVCR